MSFELESFIQKFGQVTEEYTFYNGEVTLRYDVKNHKYLLPTADGLVEQAGVTSVCHIIDKSEVLMNWAVKMMAQKLYERTPIITLPTGEKIVGQMSFEDFEKIVLEAKNAHKDRKEEAGEVGHIAHDWIEQYIKSVIAKDEPRTLRLLSMFPLDERAKNACLAALEWMARHNVRWLETERKIYSRTYKYAGTMDGLCIVDSCDNPNCCPNSFKDRLTVADWKTSNYLYLEYLLQTAAYEAAYEEEFGVDVQDRWVIRLGKEDGEFDPWHLEGEDFSTDFQAFLTCLSLVRSVEMIDNRIKAKARLIRESIQAEKKAAREAKVAAEKAAKAQAKAEQKQARAEALALKCKASDKYKAVRKPGCKTGKDGGPCVSCTLKYAEAQKTKKEAKEAAKSLRKVKSKSVEGDVLKALIDLVKPEMTELVPMVIEAEIGKEWDVTTKQIMDAMVVPTEEAIRCDGEHGGQSCGSPYCWLGEPPPICKAGAKPQLLLTAGKEVLLLTAGKPEFTIGESVSYHFESDENGDAVVVYWEDEETVRKFYETWNSPKGIGGSSDNLSK